jgi:hypothetical protein
MEHQIQSLKRFCRELKEPASATGAKTRLETVLQASPHPRDPDTRPPFSPCRLGEAIRGYLRPSEIIPMSADSQAKGGSLCT